MKYNIFQRILICLFFKNVKTQHKRPDLALWDLIDKEKQSLRMKSDAIT